MSVPELDIPAWVNWIARDADGTWWGYSAEPHPHDHGWYENEVGDCIRLGQANSDGPWQDSLHKITVCAR